MDVFMSESRCEKCKDVLYQCTACAELDKAIRKSLKPKKITQSNQQEKQKLFQSVMHSQFVIKPISRDGHCLFRCFVQGYEKLCGERLTVAMVRASVADHLISEITSKGSISGQPYECFEKQIDGSMLLAGEFQARRGSSSKKQKAMSLQEYALQLRGALYGGDLEIAVLANKYDVTINVYSWHFFDGRRNFAPQKYGSGRREISFLFEQDFSSQKGGRDHYDLILSDKFEKWRAYMNAMPKWNQDIGICYGSAGRGIKALKDFKKGDVLLYYDGHRVNERGETVIKRETVAELFEQFSLDSHVPCFVRTHAVSLGRTHITGLLIDGYPLTLPQLDEVEVVGRGALANSGSPHDSNMKMVWIEAPDLAPDAIDHLRDCEAFLIAKRDIQSGEELLWHYALHNVRRIRLVDSLHDLSVEDSDCGDTNVVEQCVDAHFDGNQYSHSVLSHSANLSDASAPLSDPPCFNFDESEDDLGEYNSHDPGDFRIGDNCVVRGEEAVIVGRIVSRVTRRVQKYVVIMKKSDLPVTVAFSAVAETSNLDVAKGGMDDEALPADAVVIARSENGSAYDAPGADYVLNESGVLAAELAGRVASFDVGKMSVSDIWNSILTRRELSGGMLLRTILIAASSDTQCLPLWPHSTQLEKRVDERKLQGIDFIEHFNRSQQKIEWLRVKLFSTVIGNRNTYAKIRVTFNGCTSLTLASVRNGIELTPSLKCRIAHMALDSDCITLLSLIFGSRDNREKHDNKDMQGTALWEQLAKMFVNNVLWQPFSEAAASIPELRDLDPSVAPPSPGLDHSIVQDTFIDCRANWTRLKSRVFSSTGCNSTGALLLKTVWENYINGGRLHFNDRTVTMYVFATWHAAGRNLPELCNRQLAPHQQLQIGVSATTDFTSPNKSGYCSKSLTPRSSGSRSGKSTEQETAIQLIAKVCAIATRI